MRKLTAYEDSHLRIFERPPVPDTVRDIYLIGICGTGMGSLAGLLKQAGYQVSGSDAAAYPPMSTHLADLGIKVHEGYNARHLDTAPDLVVVGNACTPTHVEAAAARDRGLPQVSLPEAVGHFFLKASCPVVVAGTHGKTTTAGLLVHLLREAGLDPGYLVGGVPVDSGASCHIGSGRHFVIEGDEYDSAYFDKRPKFMHYLPQCAVITSMEFDHADIYDDWHDYQAAFCRFAELVDPDGFLVLCGDDPQVRRLRRHTRAKTLLYGLAPGLDVTARDIEATPGGLRFTLEMRGRKWPGVQLSASGRYNLLNALAACTMAIALDADSVPESLASFRGMKRRMEVLGTAAGVTVVDDFAHHPTAVRATIQAVRERWPHRRLVAVFEPRSNSSRRKIFEKPYTEAFDDADFGFLRTPPFRHNDDSKAFMDASGVAAGITGRGTPAEAIADVDVLLSRLQEMARQGDVVLIMSNGSFGGMHRRLLRSLADKEQ